MICCLSKNEKRRRKAQTRRKVKGLTFAHPLFKCRDDLENEIMEISPPLCFCSLNNAYLWKEIEFLFYLPKNKLITDKKGRWYLTVGTLLKILYPFVWHFMKTQPLTSKSKINSTNIMSNQLGNSGILHGNLRSENPVKSNNKKLRSLGWERLKVTEHR